MKAAALACGKSRPTDKMSPAKNTSKTSKDTRMATSLDAIRSTFATAFSRFELPELDPATELADRVETRTIVESRSLLTDDHAAAAKLVLAEIKDTVKAARDQNQTTEAKANQVVTLSFAILAFTGAFRSGVIFATPLVAVTVIAAMVAIAFATAVAFPRRVPVPDSTLYNLESTLCGKGAEARIASTLSESWAVFWSNFSRGLRIRSARLRIAYFFLYVALVWTLALVTWFTAFGSPAAAARAADIVSGLLPGAAS